MDAIARLTAAIAEARARMGGGGRRRPGKNKKVKAVARPAKGGPSAGCGTGAGGFKAGNQCAKEDGIPRKPLGQGGALKKADPKADIALAKKLREKAAAKKARKEALDRAKSEAARPTRDARKKQRRLEYLRRAASERKAAREKMSEAEKKKSAEAAAKKRAAMIQKIRIKKANEKISIVDAPQVSRQKQPGESEVDAVVRENGTAFSQLHKRLDDIEAAYETRIDGPRAAIKSMSENREWHWSQARHKRDLASKESGALKSVYQKEADDHSREAEKYTKDIQDAHEIANRIESRRTQEVHAVVTEFVSKQGGGLATANPDKQISIDVKSSKRRDAFRSSVRDAYYFLNSALSPVHQGALSAVKVRLVKKAGADYDSATRSARHGTSGRHADYHTSTPVVVHEVAHGLHYGDGSAPGNRAVAAIKDDYDTRVAELLSKYPSLKKVRHSAARKRYFGYRVPGKRGSQLGYCDDYCDFENGNSTGATEVVTMGVQRLYQDPIGFRKNYRRHYNLTMAFLAGMLHR